MSFAVVVKFPYKPGQGEAMGDLFRAAVSDTCEFAGCEQIDVVLNEAPSTYFLVEYWDQDS